MALRAKKSKAKKKVAITLFNLRFTEKELDAVDAACAHESERTEKHVSRHSFCMRAALAAAEHEMKA